VHLDGFNLNLLVALDTLFESPTLTEAARRLTLTQPAVSGALKRLREHYDDQLIVYFPTGPRLTPLGEQLKPLVRRIIVSASDTLKLQPTFDPRISQGDLLICAADWLELVLLKDLLRAIATQAPHLRVSVRSTRPQQVEGLFGEGADLVLTSTEFISAHHSSEVLFEEQFACMAWIGNPQVKNGLTRETFIASPHVGLLQEPTSPDPMFQKMSADRTIVARTSLHAALPEIIIGTELLAATSRRFAEQAARTHPIEVFPLPYEIPPLTILSQWQPYRDSDGLILWLRDQLKDCVNRMDRHQHA
jgi:LysR family nod box-dependent transcriptional activator